MKRFWKCIVVLLLSAMCIGCTAPKEPLDENDVAEQENQEISKDYSELDFTDITWTRATESDTEYISFHADGSFSYYCACGNPVNDSDLCEGYSYDEAAKTVTLECFEVTETMITEIIVVSCSEDSLELNFDGEIRTFTREEAE